MASVPWPLWQVSCWWFLVVVMEKEGVSLAVNREDVYQELLLESDAYETALVGNDAGALIAFFWDSPLAVRYGPSEHLYGSEEIAAFRHVRSPKNLDRKVLRKEVFTIGQSAGVVNVEFERVAAGVVTHGRMSQYWTRFPDAGWKIVSAHVSHAI